MAGKRKTFGRRARALGRSRCARSGEIAAMMVEEEARPRTGPAGRAGPRCGPRVRRGARSEKHACARARARWSRLADRSSGAHFRTRRTATVSSPRLSTGTTRARERETRRRSRRISCAFIQLAVARANGDARRPAPSRVSFPARERDTGKKDGLLNAVNYRGGGPLPRPSVPAINGENDGFPQAGE